MSVLLWKPRNAGASDKQVTFLLPKIGTQNETLDSDIEEGLRGCLPSIFIHLLILMSSGWVLVSLYFWIEESLFLHVIHWYWAFSLQDVSGLVEKIDPQGQGKLSFNDFCNGMQAVMHGEFIKWYHISYETPLPLRSAFREFLFGLCKTTGGFWSKNSVLGLF